MNIAPQSIAPENLLQALQWRYSVQKFDPTRTISPEVWAALEQSLVLTASSFGLQPWKFVVVTNPEIRTQLRAASWNQSQITDASHLLVMAARREPDATDVEHYLNRIVEVRNSPIAALEGLKKTLMRFVQNPQKQDLDRWAANQVFIALGNFLTAAALLGVDACPIGGFQREPYDEILGLTQEGYTSVVLAPAGYRSADDKYATVAKVRFKADDVLRHVR